MRPLLASCAILVGLALLAGPRHALAGPDETVRQATQTLSEIMTIPASQIPGGLLAEAQGVAIVPSVIKIGFIAGVRRGHGVVLVRGADGAWGLPQFLTLTGGSVGWQAGVQDTDVVLVFMTKRSIEGLMRGKFTIGADAAVAAGPVGRNAAAATDARLRAEILSYSRSRGLFAGIALDGTALEINPTAQTEYYGVAPGQAASRIPDSATKLLEELSRYSNHVPPAVPAGTTLTSAAAASTELPRRQALRQSATRLNALIDSEWQAYLALPKEVFADGAPPTVDALQASQRQFERLLGDQKYHSLTDRGEFRSTYELLRQYTQELAGSTQLTLPPPPAQR